MKITEIQELLSDLLSAIEDTYAHDDNGNRVDGDSPISGADFLERVVQYENDLSRAKTELRLLQTQIDLRLNARHCRVVSEQNPHIVYCNGSIDDCTRWIRTTGQEYFAGHNFQLIATLDGKLWKHLYPYAGAK